MPDPLASPSAYEAFIYALPDRYAVYPALNPGLYRIGVAVWPSRGARCFSQRMSCSASRSF